MRSPDSPTPLPNFGTLPQLELLVHQDEKGLTEEPWLQNSLDVGAIKQSGLRFIYLLCCVSLLLPEENDKDSRHVKAYQVGQKDKELAEEPWLQKDWAWGHERGA